MLEFFGNSNRIKTGNVQVVCTVCARAVSGSKCIKCKRESEVK